MNALLLGLLFSETHQVKNKISFKPQRAFKIFIAAFKHEKIKDLSIIFFVFILGWSGFYSFISMYLVKVHNFSATHVSLFMAVMGIGFGIGNSVLLNYFYRRFSLKTGIIIAILVSAFMVFVMINTHGPIYPWALVTPIAATIALAIADTFF